MDARGGTVAARDSRLHRPGQSSGSSADRPWNRRTGGDPESVPERGYRYHERPDQTIRILLYGHYRIAYLVRDQGDIDILGVFHGALSIDRYL